MPVEIRELVIRAVVTGGTDEDGSGPPPAQQDSQDELVARCVQEVLRILERERER